MPEPYLETQLELVSTEPDFYPPWPTQTFVGGIPRQVIYQWRNSNVYYMHHKLDNEVIVPGPPRKSDPQPVELEDDYDD